MTQFLQSDLTLFAGVLLALLLLALRSTSSNALVRRNLLGASYYFVVFLVFRAGSIGFGGLLPDGFDKLLRVGWMLAFAFGSIRAVVSLLLWGVQSRTEVPQILRDVIDVTLYAAAAVPILKSQLGIDVTGLLATSAILSVVLGLALQDTLGNLFAGLSLQLEQPFQVGDVVTVGEHTGRVMQLAWRSTRIETFRREVVTLPNNVVAKHAVLNFSDQQKPVALDVYFDASYANPPNLVRSAVLSVLSEIAGVLQSPQSMCRVVAFADSGIRYQIRYFVADYGQGDNLRDLILSMLWYRFGRDQIEIPYPHRTVLHREAAPSKAPFDSAIESVRELMDQVDLFQLLSNEERERVARELVPRHYGHGEKVIVERAEGQTFYLVSSGEVAVRTEASDVEIARLRRGEYFGEMSLLTGEVRSATVTAVGDAVLLELDRPCLRRLFETHPGLAKQLSTLLAQRRSHLQEIASTAERSGESGDVAPEAGRILARLRKIFGPKVE